MKNVKPPMAKPICQKCSGIWNGILIIHEPDTEYVSLSYEERMRSQEVNFPEDRDSYIDFK